MARAPVSKTGGWGFEFLHSCHFQSSISVIWASWLLTISDPGLDACLGRQYLSAHRLRPDVGLPRRTFPQRISRVGLLLN